MYHEKGESLQEGKQNLTGNLKLDTKDSQGWYEKGYFYSCT